MRVSGDEFVRVSELRADAQPVFGTASLRELMMEDRTSSVTAREARRVAESLESVMDVREDIVASLKERIEAGTYQVSGEAIAEMMIRRSRADRLR